MRPVQQAQSTWSQIRAVAVIMLVLLACATSLVRYPPAAQGARGYRAGSPAAKNEFQAVAQRGDREMALGTGGSSALRAVATRSMLAGIKMLNYYPEQYNWSNMWTHWSPSTIDSDFARIAALHANAVRVILQAWTIGYPSPQPIMLSRLAQMIDLAAKHGLRVQLTLFDWWDRYADLFGSREWLSDVLAPYATDPRIAFVELQNEVDPADPAFVGWARQMIPYVHTVFPAIPVTISVYGVATLQRLLAALQSSPLDFADLHYYGAAWCAGTTLRQAAVTAAPLPMFVGETGFSTSPDRPEVAGLPDTPPDLEAFQDYYFRSVAYAARSLGLPEPAVWTLHDFAPGSLTWTPASSPEYGYGIVRTDGSTKPVASSVASAYGAGVIDASFDNGFELCTAGAEPPLWRYANSTTQEFSCDLTVAHTGKASLRFSPSTGAGVNAPYLYVCPVWWPGAPGQTYVVTAWAMRVSAAGRPELALQWFDAAGMHLGPRASATLASGTATWSQLRVQTTAPAGAAYAQISLRSTGPGATWFDDVAFES